MERFFIQEVPAIKLKICFYIKGIKNEEDLEQQVKDILEQFLPKRKDKFAVNQVSFQAKFRDRGALVVIRMILPPEYRTSVFKSVAYLQEEKENYEVVHLSLDAIVTTTPKALNQRRNG